MVYMRKLLDIYKHLREIKHNQRRHWYSCGTLTPWTITTSGVFLLLNSYLNDTSRSDNWRRSGARGEGIVERCRMIGHNIHQPRQRERELTILTTVRDRSRLTLRL